MKKVVRVFTDGACSGNPGPGGWATVFSKDNGCKHLSGFEVETTNNRMELLAVIVALRNVVCKKHKYIWEIHSDSAYVVNAIQMGWIYAWYNNGWRTTKGDIIKNRDLWSECYGLLRKVNKEKIAITFVKVKGHNGNPMNEYADKIAVAQSKRARRLLEREA